jgi:glycosyltransferase involved in cell wall biosynthesis
MKIHVLSNPHRATTPIYDEFDPFAVIVYKYIENLKHKYEFIHYGLIGSNVDCEHHTLSPDLDKFNSQASVIIGDRKEPGDIALCFFGYENQGAVINHPDLKVIEPVIGYTPHGVFAQYKVFKSYAIMHYYYGIHGNIDNPVWFDAVIPYGEDPKNFTFNPIKEDYILLFGRVIPSKGLHLAIEAAGAAGVKLDWQATWRNWVRNQRQERLNPADIAKVTVPSKVERDPALQKLDDDYKTAKPNPEILRMIRDGLKGKMI